MSLLKEKINSNFGVVYEHDRSRLTEDARKIRTFEAEDGRVICFDPSVSTYAYFQRETGINLTPPAPARNIQAALEAGKFVSCPGDVYTVQATRNMLSGSIMVHVTNEGTMNPAAIKTDEHIALPNNLDAWIFLQKMDNMGGREVFHQFGDETPVPYKESGPYRYRFGNNARGL